MVTGIGDELAGLRIYRRPGVDSPVTPETGIQLRHNHPNSINSVHRPERAIHFGGIAVARGRRHDELVAISGSLTLLTNLAMAWTTHKLQGVLEVGQGAPFGAPTCCATSGLYTRKASTSEAASTSRSRRMRAAFFWQRRLREHEDRAVSGPKTRNHKNSLTSLGKPRLGRRMCLKTWPIQSGTFCTECTQTPDRVEASCLGPWSVETCASSDAVFAGRVVSVRRPDVKKLREEDRNKSPCWRGSG